MQFDTSIYPILIFFCDSTISLQIPVQWESPAVPESTDWGLPTRTKLPDALSVQWGLRDLPVPLEEVDQLVHPDHPAKGENREGLEDLALQEHRENMDTQVTCETF